jgi:hypothetical protein
MFAMDDAYEWEWSWLLRGFAAKKPYKLTPLFMHLRDHIGLRLLEQSDKGEMNYVNFANLCMYEQYCHCIPSIKVDSETVCKFVRDAYANLPIHRVMMLYMYSCGLPSRLGDAANHLLNYVYSAVEGASKINVNQWVFSCAALCNMRKQYKEVCHNNFRRVPLITTYEVRQLLDENKVTEYSIVPLLWYSKTFGTVAKEQIERLEQLFAGLLHKISFIDCLDDVVSSYILQLTDVVMLLEIAY